jgi:hypothetical protein
MTRSRGAALLAALLTLAVALAACGGDDDGDSSADEQEIIDAITAAATSDDPAKCTEFQTQNFTEQISDGATGQAAVTQCEQNAAETPAEEIEVENVEIDGDSATAEGAITGSFFDGQTIDVALVQEGDQWKLDELVGFVDFDRDAFTASFEESIGSEEGASRQAVDCVTQQIEAQSDQQLQDFLLGTDPQAEDQIFEPCSRFFGGGE